MDGLDQARQEFEGDLERLAHLLDMIATVREFGGSDVPEVVASGATEWKEAISLHESAVAHRADLPLISGSLVLYLCGRFEYFFRTVVETAADSIASEVDRFTDLPDKLQDSLIRFTAEAAQNHKRYGYDSIQVRGFIGVLAGNFSAESGLGEINSQCVSVTETNLRPGVMQELLTRIGVSDLWPELGKQTRVKTFLETVEDKETTQAAKSLLDEIMDERNSVAHPTAAMNFPEPKQVQRYSNFLQLLGAESIDVIRVKLKKISGGP